MGDLDRLEAIPSAALSSRDASARHLVCAALVLAIVAVLVRVAVAW